MVVLLAFSTNSQVGVLADCFNSVKTALENLRHFDSYIYLTAINALAELTSWRHAQFLPKMMFLLQQYSTTADEESDEEESHGMLLY